MYIYLCMCAHVFTHTHYCCSCWILFYFYFISILHHLSYMMGTLFLRDLSPQLSPTILFLISSMPSIVRLSHYDFLHWAYPSFVSKLLPRGTPTRIFSTLVNPLLASSCYDFPLSQALKSGNK